MTQITTFDHNVRSALSVLVFDAMVAAGANYTIPASSPVAPRIQWPNEPLTTAPLDRYLRFGYFPTKPLPREMGPTPAMTTKGLIRLDTFVRKGIGQDQADIFTGIVRDAYPYALQLVRNGVQVTIDVTEVKPAAESGTWWMTNINVYWDVWR